MVTISGRATIENSGGAVGHDANADFLKGMVRRHWQDKLDGIDKQKGKFLAAEIDTHLSNLSTLINPLEYEIHGIPNIVSHAKHMQAEELCSYLRLIESIAIGYSSVLGKDVASVALIGITAKARSADGAEKYYRLLFNHIESRMKRYGAEIAKRRRRVERISAAAQGHQASILRFFKRGRIIRLKRSIELGNRRIDALNKKFERYNNINHGMRIKAKKG